MRWPAVAQKASGPSSSQGQEHPDKAKRGRRKQEKENTNGFCKRFTGLNGKWVFDCAGLSSRMLYEYFDNCCKAIEQSSLKLRYVPESLREERKKVIR